MTVSNDKAYRKGLFSVRIWPMLLFILISGGLVYLTFLDYLKHSIALYLIAAVGLLSLLRSLYAIGKWKKWMVLNADDPKITLEKARNSFIKSKLFENLAFMGSASKAEFLNTYDERMSAIRVAKLDAASLKFDANDKISVHQKLTSTSRLLVFEFIVAISVALLFFYQEDLTIRLIAGALFIISLMGIYYTLKTLWKKNKTVLEVSQRGIRIDNMYYGWGELEIVDIVKGDTLIYRPKGKEQKERRVDQLSLPADYLDELILFYNSTYHKEKDSSLS